VVSSLAAVFSDLDLVGLHPDVENAWRESSSCESWPIEAFVHDTETLHYSRNEIDRASGVPSLPRMVLDDTRIRSESDLSTTQKGKACQAIEARPPLLTCERLNQRGILCPRHQIFKNS